MKPQSYYSPDDDLAYIHVRPSAQRRTEALSWGLRDYDVKTDELAGIEIWRASKVLPGEMPDALPHLGAATRSSPAKIFTRRQPA